MNSITSKVGSTTAIFSEEIVNASNPSNTIATVASAALSLSIPPSPSSSNFKADIIHLQSVLKVSSEIEVLVELGKSAGTPQVSQENIAILIKDKIHSLRKHAKEPSKLASVRSDLYKLSHIAEVHYRDLKEEIFDLLTHLIHEDPILATTSIGVLDLVIDLNNDLALSQAQRVTIPFQKKIAKAFRAAVELYLRHYKMKDHLNAITEVQKKALLETQKGFGDLNKQENAALKFGNDAAIEAIKRITSDSKPLSELLERITHLATALGKAYTTDFGAFLSELGQAFQGLEDKRKERWFDRLFLMHDLLQTASEHKKKIEVLQVALETQKENCDWQLTYGILEIIERVIRDIQDVRLLETTLFGQSLSKSIKNKNSVTMQVAVRIAGVADFLDFSASVKNAKVATADDNKADEAIRAKILELCNQIINKLSTTCDGRKAILCHYNAVKTPKKAKIKKILESIIPFDAKLHEKWIRSVSPVPIKCANSIYTSLTATATKTNLAKCSLMSPRSEENDFFNAVIKGLVEDAKELISKNKDLIKRTDKEGDTPVIMAARLGHLKMVETLIAADQSGSTLLKQGFKSRNILHNAAAAGCMEIVQFCIDKEVPLESIDEDEYTPLLLAARGGFQEVCEVLIKAGANYTVTSTHYTALHLGVKERHLKVVQFFSKYAELLNNQSTKNSPTPLLLAAKLGFSELFEILLLKGADPNLTMEDDFNALHIAAEEGHVQIIRLLRKQNLLLNAENNKGLTPLMLAARKGHVKVCEALLKYGAEPNAVNNKEETALQIAVQSGKLEVVKKFAENKQIINFRNKDGEAILIWLAEFDYHQAFEVLMKAGADLLATDQCGQNAMFIAIHKNNIRIVQMLATHKLLLDSKDMHRNSPLMVAALLEKKQIFEILIKAREDLFTAKEYNVACSSARLGKIEIMEVFAKYKELINSKDDLRMTPLMCAITAGHKPVCEILIKAGADLLATDKEGSNAMHIAVNWEKNEILQMLVVHKVLINSKDNSGTTPLMLAIRKGHQPSCEVLVKAGADLLATDSYGLNAMHIAVYFAQNEIVQMLAVQNQLINSKNKIGRTPLMIAGEMGYMHICETLMQAGSDLFAIDNEGCNIMHVAANNGKIEVLQMFVTQQKLINSRNKKGETPLMLAAEAGHKSACEVLMKAGADPIATDNDGQNVIHKVVKFKKIEIVKMFAAYKELLNSKEGDDGETPLMLAVNSKQCFDVLIKAGADIFATDNDGQNVLHHASREGKNEIVQMFSNNRELMNSQDVLGRTPLMTSIEKGFKHICEQLIKDGADIFFVSDIIRSNVLHVAAKFNSFEIIPMFSNSKSLLNGRDLVGKTPIMEASSSGHTLSCQALIRAGADLFATSTGGRNVLHFAAERGCIEIVQMFAMHKQLLDGKDRSGDTPMSLAKAKGHVKVYELLSKEYGCSSP